MRGYDDTAEESINTEDLPPLEEVAVDESTLPDEAVDDLDTPAASPETDESAVIVGEEDVFLPDYSADVETSKARPKPKDGYAFKTPPTVPKIGLKNDEMNCPYGANLNLHKCGLTASECGCIRCLG